LVSRHRLSDDTSRRTITSATLKCCVGYPESISDVAQTFSDEGSKEPELERTQCDMIRRKRFNVFAQVQLTFRKVCVSLAECYPWWSQFSQRWMNLHTDHGVLHPIEPPTPALPFDSSHPAISARQRNTPSRVSVSRSGYLNVFAWATRLLSEKLI
jgi:hypothetical protein